MNPETPEAKAALGFKWAGDRIGKRHRLGGLTECWFLGAATFGGIWSLALSYSLK